MPINFDNFAENANVTIGLSSVVDVIHIDFARNPDSDVLKDLMKLEEKSGFNVHRPFTLDFVIIVPSSYLIASVAESIAQCFEQDHRLTVRRLVNDPQAFHNSPVVPVASFCN